MLIAIALPILLAQNPPIPKPEQPQEPAKQAAETPWPPSGVYKRGDGVTLPRLIKDIKPNYRIQSPDPGVWGISGR